MAHKQGGIVKLCFGIIFVSWELALIPNKVSSVLGDAL